MISNEEISLKYGLSLFCELYRIFQYTVKTLNTQDLLRKKILTEMNLIIESNFMCHDLWVDAKNKHNYDFECFLKLRKKHLSATLIFFSDITNWKFQIFEEKPISLLQEVGYLIEIISIVAHDLLKWKLQPEYNVFCYWKMQNKNSFKDEKEEYEDFMKEIKRIIQKKRENSKELKLLPLNGDFRELLEKAMGLLKEYYRFEEVDRLKAEILGGKL